MIAWLTARAVPWKLVGITALAVVVAGAITVQTLRLYAADARAALAEAHRATLESAHVDALAVLDEIQADHARTLTVMAAVSAEQRRRSAQTAREVDRLRAAQPDARVPASPACGAWAAGE